MKLILPRRAVLSGLAALPLLARPAPADTPVDVAGDEALETVLKGAAPGTVLRLAPGEYGTLSLRGGGGAPGAPLVLMPADPADPPRFDRMDLRGIGPVTLEGLHFRYRFSPGDKLNLRPFQAIKATGLTIRGASFQGDHARDVSPVDDGFGAGFGLVLTDCTETLLEDCEIRDFLRGLVVTACRSLTIRGNDLHGIRSDGMNFAQVQDVRIEANHIHDFNRALDSKDHSDMIQFWTNRTEAPTTGVVIRGNLLNSGKGWYTQSIFMRNDLVDRGMAGAEMFYRDILIEDNFILNAHLHGISVGETRGLTLRNNSVLRNPASEGAQKNPSLWTPTIRINATSEDVLIEGNITAKIEGPKGQPGWTVRNNLLVQDRSRLEPNHYSRVFVGGDPADPASYAPKPGGPLDHVKIGAPPPS